MQETPFAALRLALRDVANLNSISALIGWDEQVMLRPGGTDFRAEQSALLAGITHERFTSPTIGELLRTLASGSIDETQAVILREAQRDYDRATKLPTSLVEELSKTTVLSQAAWVEARAKKEFATFEPWLVKMIDLKRQEAACIGSASGLAYDALLDGYEPGETTATIKPVFDALRPKLVELVQRIVASGKRAPTEILQRPFPIEKQKAFVQAISERIGFDATAGRLDQSVHPFCSGIAPGDTRITTRYGEDGFAGALLGTLHETGHALYEQGLPKNEYFGTGLADATSLGIHESQSRLWENSVGRGKAFWTYFMPQLRAAFGEQLSGVGESDWLFALNDVRPSYIRTESDETTYNLHIMLRFELEQAMVNGDLSAAELPGAWDERFKAYLGLDVPDIARGCLQDVHWSCGLFGYFPTYALGNLYAAQFYEAADQAIDDLEGKLSRGEFTPLLDWLRTNIHQHGRRYRANELCERVTGKPRSADALLRHLNKNAATYYGV